MMKRREFITLIGGVAAWPVAARAQQADRVRRVGVLVGGRGADPEYKQRLEAFRQGLGWSDGGNIRIDYRYAAGSAEQFQTQAKELFAQQPDVILATTTPAAAALQRESRAVPIVFLGVSDPVGSGFVASLARPGGNLTGLLLLEESIAGKWLAMLKEMAPNLTRAALLANPATTPYEYFLRSAEAAARSLAIELVPCRVENAAEIERAIETFASAPNGGLVLPPDSSSTRQRELIVSLAARHRLPAVYNNRLFVAAGGLMSYGIDRIDDYRQVASYFDRILRGAKPADLPVRAPTKYQTSVNLKTAKALGLTVPSGLLVAADEVIE